MFSLVSLTGLVFAIGAQALPQALPPPLPVAPGGQVQGAESHQVTLVNRCGSGTPVFLSAGNWTPQGSGTINGPLRGGVAWMSDYKDCQSSGVNCGTVEFSLINTGTDGSNTHNSINYSLLTGPGLGNHQFKYPMSYQYTGNCPNRFPGPCQSAANCPGAYFGSDTFSGTPETISGSNCGITITFC